MKKYAIYLLGVLGLLPLTCAAQQAPPDIPDAPKPSHSALTSAPFLYSPPTQRERFKNYLRHTYGITSIVEAGVRGGIEQATDNPSEWPQGAQGYADRFGSAMGQIAIRGTTEYVFSDLFREDLRYLPCPSPCADSAFKRALEDTFTARKGEDGHHAFSVARILGPISGSVVAVNTWYPGGTAKSESVRETARTFGFVFARNLIHELRSH